jgi:hypothetical protein
MRPLRYWIFPGAELTPVWTTRLAEGIPGAFDRQMFVCECQTSSVPTTPTGTTGVVQTP